MSTRINSNAPAGNVRGTLSEERLRALLDDDQASGGVVAVRGGVISRSHYARLLGCTPGALTRFRSVFADYEERLGVATGPMRHLSAMREWLAAAYDARQLEIRDGKVDRVAFQTHFGLRGGTFMTRHPEIRALLEEFDARAQAEAYLPLARQEELDRVRAALTGQVVLNKDRMTINQVALAETARVPQIRFRDRPFAEAIASRQAEIMAEVEASRIDPFVHGRVYPFSDLAPIWPMRFLDRVGVRFKQVASGLAQQGAKHPYLQLVNMLDWVGRSSNPHCRAVMAEANGSGRVLSADEWEDALFAYREHLIAEIAAGRSTNSAVDTAIKALRIMLDRLSSGGVVPSTSTPLPGVKHVRRLSGKRKSVAEAKSAAGEGIEADYVAFARERFQEAAKSSGSDMGMGESNEFINGLAVELRDGVNLPGDATAAVRFVLERRLDALRMRAVTIVDAAIEAYQRGHELLASSRIDGEEFEAAYLGDALNAYERTQLVRSLFPDPSFADDGQVERGIANLLRLIEQRHGGVPPPGGNTKVGAYGQFFAKRYLAYGGLATIGPMLNPSTDAVGAVLTLYLLESGANVSVGRTLDRECIESSDLDGHRRVTGHKARAKGKPIIVDLPESSPAVRAMEWLLSASARLQSGATVDGDRLFLMRIGRRVQLMTPHWYTNWFKGFAASTPGLEGIGLVPNMIRPSVLLQAALGNDGRLAAGMALAQHGLAITQGYQQKWPTRLLYDENIRRFQAAFETLVMSGIDDAASRLGIAVEEFEARLGDLRATGLGTFCKDQRGRPGEQHGTCSTLDCWNECPNLLIVAEVEAIASLQLWQASLRTARPDWERDRPERWDQVWLPWLCLTDVVEEKMVRGPLVKTWRAAQRRSVEIFAQPGYVPPRPW